MTTAKFIIAAVSEPTVSGRQITVYQSAFPEVVATDPLIDIGSITKFVTAVCILRLVDEGAFTVQTPISELLENVPADKADITVHQLLIHTSGLIESAGPDDEYLSREQLLNEAFTAPLSNPVGEVFRYSNVGYSVLAAIVELQGGLAYESYLNDAVLEPNGLPAIGYLSVYRNEDSMRSARSLWSGFRHQSIIDASWAGKEPGWNLVGNGGLVTTAEGFLRFWDAFYAGELVSDDLVQVALTPHIDEGTGKTFYGYGLVVEPSDTHGNIFWHNGGNELFSAEWRHLQMSNSTLFTAAQGNYAFRAMSRWMENLQ